MLKMRHRRNAYLARHTSHALKTLSMASGLRRNDAVE
jgi:hypothetical protein